MPRFSVIVPTYNRRRIIAQTLQSVWNQSYRDFELIVVDDGSSDGTLEYLVSLPTRIKVVRQENLGPGAARNLGAAQASGDYLAFLDSDDIWFPWALATFAEIIDQHVGPSIISSKPVEFADAGKLAEIRIEPIKVDSFPDYFASSNANYYVGSGMMILRRDIFLESGGFIDERLNGEDHDLILRLGSASGFVQVLAPITLAYYRHSMSESSDQERTAGGILRMIKQERIGAYPGGVARARQRHRILTSHARAASLGCLRTDRLVDAWRLYLTTLGWNTKLRRWKYILLFPVLATAACCARRNWISKRSQKGLRGSAYNSVPTL